MLEDLFQPMHLLFIFAIALLLFGPKKLPELGKGIGEGIRGFRAAMKEPPSEGSEKTVEKKGSETGLQG
ncbi:MAG: twin-arginine translocase TatA/TatE family subunit [Terriglobales bacterium]